ncbi:ATP-binding protein, partial [Streptomyces sp. AK02-04a]|uniref:ATP-binding protein n=1 Tax=Streptomyces sp. AK02-04a TaxID=3028649 RepID=UPI0029BA561A|nr:LuxR family transcriptional regulator [Streptomyces sp. AK02-04a]
MPELPHSLDSFIGRARELSELRALLRVRKTRLLTLAGPGGVGKTRLALEYARGRRAGEGTPLLVELASMADGTDPVPPVAAALGVGEHGGRTGVDALAHALGGRRLLLVLDNCEHVVDGVARLVADLLGRCPALRVLATSREVLRVPGEVVLRIGQLDMGADRRAGPGRPARQPVSDAVQLFMDRATASAPGFRATGEDAVTVAEICRRLEGMPLAIELAARRTASLPVGAILAGLDDELALLGDGNRTGPERHLDLASAIDWSHRLLSPQEQALFRRLSVLRGGFTAGGAAAVTADSPDGLLPPRRILPLILALEAKSLLVRAPSPSAPPALTPGQGGTAAGPSRHTSNPETDAVRFRQLETVRAYARQRLEESGEAEKTHRRLLAWLTELVSSSPGLLYGTYLPGAALAEQENLAAAVAGAPNLAGTPGGLPPELILALARIRGRQDQLSAARTLLETGPEWPDQRLQAARLTLAALVTNWQGDTEAALQFADRAVALARLLDDPQLLATAHCTRSFARLSRREFSQAVEDGRAAVAAVAALDRPVEEARFSNQLAWSLLQAHRPAEADTVLAGCLPVLREQADPGPLACSLHTAGAVRLALGDCAAAEELFAESLRAQPTERQGSEAIEGLAAVTAARGDHPRALRLFTAAARTRSRLEGEIEPGWQDQIAPFQARA